MSNIYYDRLAANMPEYMDKSAKRLSLTEAFDKVMGLPEEIRDEKLVELGEIALSENLEGWLDRLKGEIE